MAKQLSKRSFDKIVQRCMKLETHYAARNGQCDKLENIFLMKWESEKPEAKPHIKFTVSPTARIRALGAIRLLTAADPKFSVPYEKNDEEGQQLSSKIERFANALWYVAGRVRQSPIHHDMVASSVVFGEDHCSVNSTQEILKSMKEQDGFTLDQEKKAINKAAIARAERIAAITPFVFEVYDPRTCFPDHDEYGLSAYFRKVKTTAGVIIDRWGAKAINMGLNPEERFAEVTYCEYWDSNVHSVWIYEKTDPLWAGDHGLPIIPIAEQTVDGSTIFTKPEEQVQPFLYTYLKGNMAERENLALTVMWSNVFALAANPRFVEKLQDETRVSEDNFDVPGGKKKMLVGESYEPAAVNAVDPALMNQWQLSQQMAESATIMGQALGEPLGANAPYSMVALLSQAGRLPLVTLQRRTSWAIGKAMEIALTLQKFYGGTSKVQAKQTTVELASTDIPADLIIEASLKLELPQDQKSNIQMAIASTSGQTPMAAMETSRRDFMNIDQSDDETEKIWAEKFANLAMEKKYQLAMADVQLEVARKQAELQQQLKMNDPQYQMQMAQQQQQMMKQQQMQQQQTPQQNQVPPQPSPEEQQMMAQQQAMMQQQQQMQGGGQVIQGQDGLPPMDQMQELAGLEAGGAQEGLPQNNPEELQGQ